MTPRRLPRVVRVEAFAKINLTLRVLGRRSDGYHNVRTVLQSIALHDTLTFRSVPGEFRIECDDSTCPTDETNLVWRAAEQVWRAVGRRGRLAGVCASVIKRIPLQGGLGGGSSNAAATIRALSALWRVELTVNQQHAISAALGADVPFFLHGGTALGLERGDLLFPLTDQPTTWMTLVIPPFGVSTKDAYNWVDRKSSTPRDREPPSRPAMMWMLPESELINDLEPSVSAHHPALERVVTTLRRSGAEYVAMSGSGSTVFGLFTSRARAAVAAASAARHGRTIVTRTLNREQYETLSRPRSERTLAGKTGHRIHLRIAPRGFGHS
jgi:4-diphosphocytidyl-2-C-methyl-D-erythritol kinase